MAKHTPGPWRIATTGNYGNTIEAQSGRKNYDFDTGYRAVGTFQACESTGRHKEEEENRLANGRLMAAAPELLDALKDALCALEVCGKDYSYVTSKARAAIAKATGQCLKGEE